MCLLRFSFFFLSSYHHRSRFSPRISEFPGRERERETDVRGREFRRLFMSHFRIFPFLDQVFSLTPRERLGTFPIFRKGARSLILLWKYKSVSAKQAIELPLPGFKPTTGWLLNWFFSSSESTWLPWAPPRHPSWRWTLRGRLVNVRTNPGTPALKISSIPSLRVFGLQKKASLVNEINVCCLFVFNFQWCYI